ncbi:E3 SUMO-protein ligase ZBED1-like [Pimephales promelas]|uniref:E3 SUMO-protein ligase ZBED1-like n=1 Tax=Pimephales promelas TaxID=90988 RepID=UPI0019556103|nr:E3 SUMO-protein ligase ZBED1-like [Pimephales promelas]
MRPIAVVEGQGFKNLLKVLEPGYTVPARHTITNALTAKYEGLKDKVSALIQQSEALSLTTDMWTSLRMESYMTVTAHFIDGDWKAQSLVLETKQMEEAHTGINIAARLSEVADTFGIQGKIVSVVCDNAANMTLCVETLKESHKWAEMQGVRCAGHTLQLCINAALKQDPICRAVAASRHLVGHFKKGHKAKTGLKQKQEQQNVPQHELIQDVSTRWNSTFSMLERLLEQRWPITAVLSDPNFTKKSDSSTLDLTTAHWNAIEDIKNVLKPMTTLTELLSEEDNASLSATVPMLANLKKRHLAIADDDSPITKKMKSKLVEEIDGRWEFKNRMMMTNSVYITAAVVDPRFKQLSFLDDAKRDEAYIVVAQLAERLNAVTGTGEPGSEEEQHVSKKQKNDKEKEIAMLLCEDEDDLISRESGGRSRVTEEMKNYLQDRTKIDSGPLGWWKKNQDRYPSLARVAKRLLCIPATSTPSERIFSKAGFIVNKARSCLLPKNVDMLVFLAHNTKKCGMDIDCTVSE